MPPTRSRLLPWASAAFLVALVLLAFAPALGAGFVDWDDDRNFVENLHFRGFSSANLAWMSTSAHLGHYQPLAWLTLAADHALHGVEPAGYHATNVLFHAAVAVAVLAFARRVFDLTLPEAAESRRALLAFAAAAFFALHPLRVESVAWVTERRDVVSGLFFVLALDAWLRFRVEGRGRALAFAWTALSLLAKAWGVVLPALFFVLDALVSRERAPLAWRERVVAALPAWGLALAFAGVTLWAQASGTEARATLAEHGLVARAIQSAYALAFYPWKTLLPLELSPLYSLPAPGGLVAARYLVPAACGVAGAIVLWTLRRRAPRIALAGLAFAVVIAPVSGLLQAGPQLVADRYAYLATLPFALLLASALAAPRVPLAVSAALVALVAAVLVPTTRAQCSVWRDSASLWARVLAVEPENPTALDHAAQADVARARTLADAGERRAVLERALAAFERAHAASGHPLHLLNAGAARRMLAEDCTGDERTRLVERALADVERALAEGERTHVVDPGWRRTHAALLADLGRDAEAESELARVVAEVPGNVAAHAVRADVLERLGRAPDALVEREAVARLRPNSSTAWRALGELRARMGAKDAARKDLARALELARAAGRAARDDAARAAAAEDERRASAALEAAGR
ncbi:MAG: hypothetical protein U1F29_10585 [Planctomycetota bacterium]